MPETLEECERIVKKVWPHAYAQRALSVDDLVWTILDGPWIVDQSWYPTREAAWRRAAEVAQERLRKDRT